MTLPIKITFCASAHMEVGTGHVMRCLALANVCRGAGLTTSFVGRIDDPILLGRIEEKGHLFTWQEECTVNGVLDSINPLIDWVVLDGYGFSFQDHQKIRNSGAKLLIIDDLANLGMYEADVILNQNFYANVIDYPLANDSKVLMGSQYALLRDEFLECRGELRKVDLARRFMVTLGGSDPQNIGSLVINALSEILDMQFEVCLIAGSCNQHLDHLDAEAKIARKFGHTINILRYTNEMPSIMRWANFAVIAGGTTSLEVVFMGLPSLVLTLAENQIANAEAMQALGVAESLGWYSTLNPTLLANAIRNIANNTQLRKKMAERGQELVDGLGANRVMEVILGQ